MTENRFFGQRPRPIAAGLSPLIGPTQRANGAREPSLIELMSLSDWHRFVPEALGMLLFIALIRALLPDVLAGGAMPHPFWIPVLLMSGQYGIMGGLFATLAATAALFLSGLPPQSATQDFYAYAGVIAAQPCAWLATALVLGGLRTLHIHQHSALQWRLDQSEQLAEEVVDGFEHALHEIEHLEHRIAGDSGTLASFLHSFAKLELTDRRSLVASFADVVRYGVGATSFAIYLRGDQGLEPYLCVENGVRVGSGAGAPIAPSLLSAVRAEGLDLAAEGSCSEDVACQAPIRLTGSAPAIGVILCRRLEPSQDPAIAAQRLSEISGVLAALLLLCPEIRSGAFEYANA
jgi:hypothetical protein